MREIRPYLLCTLAGFLLLIVGACNLPGSSGGNTNGGNTNTPEVLPPPSNTDGAETILIPGATFWMGSPDTDTLADADETPRHQVTLESFYLYTHEVTNTMYAACVQAGDCLPINVMENGPTTHTDDPAYADFPVVGADWNMADDYCAWAGGRLPTEAEWELAARGADSLLYPWGAEYPACDRVNMLGCAVPPDTVEVGSYALGNSPYDVWDMSGNVWEWVHDWYADGYYALSPAIAPVGPYSYRDVNDPLKVVRGGGLYSGPEKMRSADRAGANPYRAYDDVGFRCVAESALTLPEDYTETRDRHEMVPPDSLDGGGEHVEDPDGGTTPWWMEEYFATSSCPDSGGNIHIAVGIEAAPGTEFVRIRGMGVDFSCTYDEMLHVLDCEGPTPLEYDAEDTFPIWIEVRHLESDIWRTYLYMVEKPNDCATRDPGPDRFSMDLGCPQDGLFTISFFYDPPITWTIVRIVSHISAVDIPCVQVSDNEIRCTAPDYRFDDHYEFILQGTDSSGREYAWYPWVPVATGCPVNFLDAEVASYCFEDHPTVAITYHPEVMTIGSVSVYGTPLSCIGMAPNVLVCGDLPGAAGIEVDEVTICTDTGSCFTEMVPVPDCLAPGTGILHTIEAACYPSLGPVAVIHYWPSDLPLVAANANGFDLTCAPAPDNWYMCFGIPGAPGSEMTISFCLADGTCFSQPITVSDCGTATWDPDDWRLIAVGCHDATQLYFMVDTALDWLTPGADFTYSASDGETTYSCSVHATVAGRVYCSGARPVSPGDLQFCLQRPDDASPVCQTFPDYDVWVNEVPACAEEPEPVEPEPVEPEPVDPCSVHTDEVSCNSDKPACRWIYTAPTHCESNP